MTAEIFHRQVEDLKMIQKKSRALKWYVTDNKLISTHVDHYQHLHNGFLNTYNPETLLICFTPLSEWLKKTHTIISNTPI